MSIESKVYLDLARIWNVGPGEVEKMVRDYIGAVTCDFKPLQTYPKPHIKPVKVKSLKERLEEMEMNSTSTQTFKDIIAIDFELQTFPYLDVDDKFIVSATNRDDIFCFVFEGKNVVDACRKTGLFTGWEKDQRIRELEKELNDWKKEAVDCLKLRDEAQKEAYKLKKENEMLKDRHTLTKAANEKIKEKAAKLIKENKELQSKYDLERATNEAQYKFIREYTDNCAEVQFNYAIDDTKEVSYVIVDKESYQYIKDHSCNVMLHGMDFTPDQLVDRILELEKLKTPTIENFEEPSSRADILDLAKKCVCGHREQDYGSPESNFQLIADLWNQYLFKEPGAKEIFGIGPMDVAMLMALMKIARIRNGGGSGDSFVDLAGYAACGGEIWDSNKETNGDSSQETN